MCKFLFSPFIVLYNEPKAIPFILLFYYNSRNCVFPVHQAESNESAREKLRFAKFPDQFSGAAFDYNNLHADWNNPVSEIPRHIRLCPLVVRLSQLLLAVYLAVLHTLTVDKWCSVVHTGAKKRTMAFVTLEIITLRLVSCMPLRWWNMNYMCLTFLCLYFAVLM